MCHWFYTYRIHCAAGADAVDAHTVALSVWFKMASKSNEYTFGKGRARGRGYAKWREEEKERRAGKIAAVTEEVDEKVSRGTQTYESNFPQTEKPTARVKPNNHLRVFGGPFAIRLARGHPQQ